ncbi:hypothetical protein [Streptomyces tubercidicus]|uniref:hypothetical protein n=1 Tax=Streptomyces tubercidicus TaxID=47759 RepID=UPI003696072E
MTYGTNDGSTTKHEAWSKPPPPEPYPHGGTYTDDSTGHLDSGDMPHIPPKPPAADTGKGERTAVDTSSLKKFADNLDVLADAVSGAYKRVDGIQPLAAGKFKEAMDLQAKVTGGPSGDKGGLRANYLTALDALEKSLRNTATNVRSLAGKYATIADVNGKAGKELRQYIGQAEHDVQALQKDAV